MLNESILKREEKAVFLLRSLYRQYGYLPFKMSKFEEYELYMRNKDFLVSDRIITFNDTNGRLLALKPDVTLSIIKNGEDCPGCKQKVCYNENVYRISERTHRFREIMQAGLECIGDIDLYDIYEVIALAAKSLALIGVPYVLEISHLGLLRQVLGGVCETPSFIEKATAYIAEKNAHDLRRLCAQYGADKKQTECVLTLVTAYGERKTVIERLRSVCDGGALQEIGRLSDLLDRIPESENIRFDFSASNDMNYYNGFVFRGFLDGISDGVLAGGQYDKMMRKMGRTSGAVGFALYLDMLEQLGEPGTGADVNILLLYDGQTDLRTLADKTAELTAAGLTVSAQKAVPEKLRYGTLIDLRKEEKPC